MNYLDFLETDTVDENTIVFTNSAKVADDLQQSLTQYSISSHVISEFTSPLDKKDIRLAWHAALKNKNNILGNVFVHVLVFYRQQYSL